MASSSDQPLTPPAGPPLLEGDGTVNPAGITYTLNVERNRRGEANVTVRGLPNTDWGMQLLRRVLTASHSVPATCRILRFTDGDAIEVTFLTYHRADKVVRLLHNNDITLTDAVDITTSTLVIKQPDDVETHPRSNVLDHDYRPAGPRLQADTGIARFPAAQRAAPATPKRASSSGPPLASAKRSRSSTEDEASHIGGRF